MNQIIRETDLRYIWSEAVQIHIPSERMAGKATSRIPFQVHLVHRHVWYMQVVLEGGNHHLPRYPKCDIFVPWRVLNGKNHSTEMCVKGV